MRLNPTRTQLQNTFMSTKGKRHAPASDAVDENDVPAGSELSTPMKKKSKKASAASASDDAAPLLPATAESLAKLNVPILKDQLRAQGLSPSGNKADLIGAFSCVVNCFGCHGMALRPFDAQISIPFHPKFRLSSSPSLGRLIGPAPATRPCESFHNHWNLFLFV